MNKIPARDTVAGVAVFRWLISNNSRMLAVSVMRSLLAKVSTYNRTHPIIMCCMIHKHYT